MGNETEYAHAVLDSSGWDMAAAIDVLISRTIAQVAEGRALRDTLRQAFAVAPEVYRLHQEHQASLLKEKNIAELRDRFADILGPKKGKKEEWAA